MSELLREHQRLPMLDLLRGLLLASMVVYHACYSWVVVYQHSHPWFYSVPVQAWQALTAGGFIFLSGICTTLARHPGKRGAWLFILALGISGITVVVVPSQKILFGILHLMGTCMVLHHFIFPKGIKSGRTWSLVLGGLFLVVWGLPKGYLGFLDWAVFEIPRTWYRLDFLFPIGLPSEGFFSADYFPLLPHGLLFFSGAFSGIELKSGRFPIAFYERRPIKGTAPLIGLGKKSLWVYLVHQPLLLALFYFLQ